MVSMHTIKDSIHQDIEINDFELGLIDSLPVQRLRRIRQMGFAYLVYPCATHSRFEHSLGTMYLAGELAEHLDFSEKIVSELRVAALLHDTGHFPFSHNYRIEKYLEEELGIDHVGLSVGYVKTHFSDNLKEAGLSTKNIIDCIRGDGKYGSIFSSGIDVDKMDYMVRDAYFTGTAYGLIDLSRLLHTTEFHKALTFHVKGLRNIEAVIINRFMMYSNVYFHRTIKIATAMFGRAVTGSFDSRQIDLHEYHQMDDIDLVSVLRKNKSSMMECLDSRRLYKLGSSLSAGDLSGRLIEKCASMSIEEIENIEEDIGKKLRIPQGKLIIDITPEKKLESIKMLDNGKTINLEEISEFSRSVMNQECLSWNILFLSPEKYRGSIASANKLFMHYI